MKTTEEQLHLARHALLAIHDLASARLRNPPLESNAEHDLTQIVHIADLAMATEPNVYPPPPSIPATLDASGLPNGPAPTTTEKT